MHSGRIWMNPITSMKTGNRFENAIFYYYRFVDTQIGELLEFADSQTTVFVASDHGAKKMEGSICINEWLIREGYLSKIR